MGQVLSLAPVTVKLEDIFEFAAEFDPQPIHLDEKAAKEGLYGGIIASGWHTCALYMRMMCDGFLNNSLSQGAPGIDEILWKKPVYPNDTLRGETTITSTKASRTRPALGFLGLSHKVTNQHGDVVLEMTSIGMMGVRNPITKGAGNGTV